MGEGAPGLGQALDLKGAFRQVAVRDEHQKFAVVACWDPSESKVKLDELAGVVLGTKRSASAIARVGLAL